MHDHAAMLVLDSQWPGASLPALQVGLFLVGLSGGFLHCAGMCGPFVLARIGLKIAGNAKPVGLNLDRLRGGALVPYHLGRCTTYMVLGALAGATGAGAAGIWHWVPTIAMAFGAALFFVQAIGPLLRSGCHASRWGPVWLTSLGSKLTAALGLQGIGLYPFGLILGLLPCGMVYGVLPAAISAGTPLRGALVMLAFAAGTLPALLIVGASGAAAIHGARRLARIALPILYLFNAAVLATMAARNAF